MAALAQAGVGIIQPATLSRDFLFAIATTLRASFRVNLDGVPPRYDSPSYWQPLARARSRSYPLILAHSLTVLWGTDLRDVDALLRVRPDTVDRA